jgi:hypothetical protein
MTGSQRTALTVSAIAATRIVFLGAILGGSALGLSTTASAASQCDPLTLSMTPQPALSCPDPYAASPADPPPVPDPANFVGGPPPQGAPPPPGQPLPDAFPAPGQPPGVPPVVGDDGAPTQSFGQGGYLKDIWGQFHNGVPSDLVFGSPPPAPDPALPPPPPG